MIKIQITIRICIKQKPGATSRFSALPQHRVLWDLGAGRVVTGMIIMMMMMMMMIMMIMLMTMMVMMMMMMSVITSPPQCSATCEGGTQQR